jgi:hypothetical protein
MPRAAIQLLSEGDWGFGPLQVAGGLGFAAGFIIFTNPALAVTVFTWVAVAYVVAAGLRAVTGNTELAARDAVLAITNAVSAVFAWGIGKYIVETGPLTQAERWGIRFARGTTRAPGWAASTCLAWNTTRDYC